MALLGLIDFCNVIFVLIYKHIYVHVPVLTLPREREHYMWFHDAPQLVSRNTCKIPYSLLVTPF